MSSVCVCEYEFVNLSTSGVNTENTMTLTEKQISRLINQTNAPEHQINTVTEWINNPHRQPWQTHFLIELSKLKKSERECYYLYNNTFYYVDTNSTKKMHKI